LKIYIVTFEEINPISGEVELLVSHGIDEKLNNHILPERLLEIPNVKYDKEAEMIYIETEENNNEV